MRALRARRQDSGSLRQSEMRDRKRSTRHTELLQTLARNVARLRDARGLTQTALAAHVQMSRARLNQLEQAKQDARISTVLRLAHVLNVSVAKLFTEPRKTK